MTIRRLIVLGVAAAMAWLLLWPLPPARDVGPRAAAAGYDDAVARFEAFRAARDTGLAPECATELLGHGRRTERAIVLLHGLSNCPRQFDSLARVLHAGGASVLVPRFPYHGLADRMTDELRRLHASQIEQTTAEAVAIARGLGDTVIVAGLSMGGVATAWAAQNLPGIEHAVLISPALGPGGVPPWLVPPLTRAAVRLPNFNVWWSAKLKEHVPGAIQTYPRFASRALANIYRVGIEVLDDAARPPRTRSMVVVASDADRGINHAMMAELVERWRAHGAGVVVYQYAREDRVQHDMVDPTQPDQQVALVYPLLVRAIERVAPPPNP